MLKFFLKALDMVGPLDNNGRQQSHGDYHSIPQPGKACALDIRGLTRLQALLPT